MPHLCITAPERTSSRGSTPKMSVEQVKRTSEGWVKSSLGFRFVVRTVSKYCGFGADHINLTPWGSEDQRMPISVERNGLFQQKSTFVSDPQINATCAKCTIFLCRRRRAVRPPRSFVYQFVRTDNVSTISLIWTLRRPSPSSDFFFFLVTNCVFLANSVCQHHAPVRRDV